MSTAPAPQTDLARLRVVLARELETINEYEQYAAESDDDTVRSFFAHLADEEKEHVAEAMRLILKRDARQQREWDEADVSAAHFSSEQAGADVPAAPASGNAAADTSASPAASPVPKPEATALPSSVPQSRPRLAHKLTIGSLRGVLQPDDK